MNQVASKYPAYQLQDNSFADGVDLLKLGASPLRLLQKLNDLPEASQMNPKPESLSKQFLALFTRLNATRSSFTQTAIIPNMTPSSKTFKSMLTNGKAVLLRRPLTLA